MNTNDFDFDLPEELIAQTLLKTRCLSNSLILDRKQGKSRTVILMQFWMNWNQEMLLS